MALRAALCVRGVRGAREAQKRFSALARPEDLLLGSTTGGSVVVYCSTFFERKMPKTPETDTALSFG